MRTIILSIHLADEPGIPEGYLHNIKKDITAYLVERGDATVLQVTSISKEDHKAMVAESMEQVAAQVQPIMLPVDAKVAYIPAVLPSEAVYGMIAYLASRTEGVTISKRKDPAAAMQLANDFITANGWEPARDGWEQSIEFPNIMQEINDRKTEMAQLLMGKPKKAAKAPEADPGLQDTQALAGIGRIPELDNTQGSMFDNVLGDKEAATLPVEPFPGAAEVPVSGRPQEMAPGVAEEVVEDPFN